MYAVFEACGSSHKVKKGQVIRLEKIEKELGATIEFDKVLFLKNGDVNQVGSPYLKGSKVICEIIDHGRKPKIDVIKFKRRKGYLRKIGHRQWYTDFEVKDIIVGSA